MLTALAVVAVLGSLTVTWTDAGSWPGEMARDQWLIHVIESEQRDDGLFVFSNADTVPPVIAETYFAVTSLSQLGATVPGSSALLTSLKRLEDAAELSLQKGTPVLDGRDLYEVVMIHRLLASPLPGTALTGHTALLHKVVKTSPLPAGFLRSWYYGLQALKLLGKLTADDRAAATAAAGALLQSAEVTSLPVLATDLLADALTMLDAPLSEAERAITIDHLHKARTSHGAFGASELPDMLATFFSILAAQDLGARNVVNAAEIRAWINTQRTWSGYRVASGQPVTPLATAYALSIRRLLEAPSADIPK